MKQEIDIPDLPKGYKAVAYRYPNKGEYFISLSGVQRASMDILSLAVILEKMKPRRIVLEEITTEDIDTNTKLYNILGSYWIEAKEGED